MTRQFDLSPSRRDMRTLGNIIWLVFAGFGWRLLRDQHGIVMFILIITIPFGIAAFRMAGYALWPFRAHCRLETHIGSDQRDRQRHLVPPRRALDRDWAHHHRRHSVHLHHDPLRNRVVQDGRARALPLGKDIVPIDQAPTGQYTVVPIGEVARTGKARSRMAYDGIVEAGVLLGTRTTNGLDITKVSVGPMDNNAYLLRDRATGRRCSSTPRMNLIDCWSCVTAASTWC